MLRAPALVQNVGLFLVALALALRVLIPSGYMVAAPKAGALPVLVICTGHGPLVIDPSGQPATKGDPARPSQDDASNHPCTFAGGGLAFAPPLSVSLAAPIAFLAAPVLLRVLRDQQPGRGLAAPPPPTTGPPSIA